MVSQVFYPPAAISLGLPVDRIIWVRPKRHSDLVWAIDQALRCESVAAVWAYAGVHLDDRDARRFQLASEAGKTAGLLVRPTASRGRPSFAEVRFHVKHLATGSHHDPFDSVVSSRGSIREEIAVQSHRALQVTVDRCRGGTSGQQTAVQIDDHGSLHTIHWHHNSVSSTGCSKGNRYENGCCASGFRTGPSKDCKASCDKPQSVIRFTLIRFRLQRFRLCCGMKIPAEGVWWSLVVMQHHNSECGFSMKLAEAADLVRSSANSGLPQSDSARRPPLIQRHDKSQDQRSLEQIAVSVQRQITPKVALEELAAKPWAGHPRHQCESLLCDTSGVSHLFGDESGLLVAVEAMLAARHVRARMAIADSVAASWALAHEATMKPLGVLREGPRQFAMRWAESQSF